MSDQRRNVFRSHSDELLIGALEGWARDQREREGWQDGDEATYRHNASLLEEAARRLADQPIVGPIVHDYAGTERCQTHPDRDDCPRAIYQPIPIGHVDGARSVCCGHGRFEGFVLWPGVAAGCKVPDSTAVQPIYDADGPDTLNP